jgi:surface antigen
MIAAGALILAGCGRGGEITTGAIAGASPGIVLHSPVGAGAGETPIGAIEGGLLGTDVGRSLSEADREIALRTEYEALEYSRASQPKPWRGASGETRGQVNVGGIYQVNRLECRDYSHNVWIGGRLRVVRGTACREPDAVWRIVS